MSSIAISSITFACVFGGALAGIYIQRALPEHHLSKDTKDAVKLGMGLVGTMTALILGLLVSSAKSSFDVQNTELTEMSAKVIVLDRVLAHYGPETKEARGLLREAVAGILERTWPQSGAGASQLGVPPAVGETFYEKIQQLTPKDDAQRSLQSQALSVAMSLGQTRWLMFEQGTTSVSRPLLVLLVFWLTLTFMSFGLFAPANATVVASLFVSAFSVSGAVLLILEMYSPYAGMIQISSAPLRAALAHLGQ
jgi:hypothetical protein